MLMKQRSSKHVKTERKVPRQKRSKGMVESILEAATRVLSARELDEVSTNVIAEAAGISIGSFYQYFPNKEKLATALLERFMGEDISNINFLEALDRGMDTKASPDTIEAMVQSYMEVFFVHAVQHRKLLRVLSKHIFRLNVFDHIVKVRTAIRGHLAKRLVQAFGLPGTDADEIAWVIMTSVIGVLESILFTDLSEQQIARLQKRTTAMITVYLRSLLS
jgi:AcrR family transcriptional regulator